jgi:hypothetical protein
MQTASSAEIQREIRRMKRAARDLWMTERARLVTKGGPGFARFSDKRSAGTMFVVVDNLMLAGCEWRDIADGIKAAAADPRAGPWSVFDHALAALERRDSEFRMNLKLKMEREVGSDAYADSAERIARIVASTARLRRMPK